MTARNGAAARIVAFVAAHPGCTRAEILAGCGIVDIRDAMPTYCAKRGLIFAAGPRGTQHYYPTAEQAQAAHDGLVQLAEQRRLEAKRRAWRVDNERLKAQREQDRPKVRARIQERNAARRRARALLPKDVKMPLGVKITVAPPMRDRWAA